ncbi:hypothetical protein [Natroniella sp. ANB-PHB2]|uniref:hypothetical protein n=1 Tax=Natroniella sp. ANB-PHB2 TaxID=3384444 RepID=UPI0038D44869
MSSGSEDIEEVENVIKDRYQESANIHLKEIRGTQPLFSKNIIQQLQEHKEKEAD